MNNTFAYQIQGTIIHADPCKVRRLLLDHTDGRAWMYARDLAAMKDELKTWRQQESSDESDARVAILLKSTSKLEGMLAKAAMEAFDFVELDAQTGQGVTEKEALETLQNFMVFAEGKE